MDGMFLRNILLIFVHILLYTSCIAHDDSLIVKAPCGDLRGRLVPVVHGSSVRQFLGVPYAEPPTGALRFARPQPALRWTGVKDALTAGPECPQVSLVQMAKEMNATFPDDVNLEVPQSEDCLSLNVYVPAHASADGKLAVMVWIHGGAFSIGSGSSYNPSVLVALNDVIVVTINYRLGVFGFFNIPGTDVKGNFGMHDQVLSLKWVKQNIAAFGGDPDLVTIFGESAGGISVGNHILSPLSKGLFRHGIAQSGASGCPINGLEVTSTKTLEIFSEVLKCDIKMDTADLMECLRSKTIEDILSAQRNISFPRLTRDNFLTLPIIDGEFLPDVPKNLLKQGKANDAKLLMGTTSNEGGLFYLFDPKMNKGGLDMEAFKASLKQTTFGLIPHSQLLEDAILLEYLDHSDPNNPRKLQQAAMDIGSDAIFTAPVAMYANSLSQSHHVYLYVLDHLPHFSRYPSWVGCYHGVDISYVFGMPFSVDAFGEDVKFLSPIKFSDFEVGFSKYMMALWTNFAKYGDPNHGENLPITWPRYNTTDHVHLKLAMEPKLERNLRQRKVAFWNEFVPKLTAQEKARDGENKSEEKQKDEL